MRVERIANLNSTLTFESESKVVEKAAKNNDFNNQKPQFERKTMPNYTELSKKDDHELSVHESAWINMIERANKAIAGTQCDFEYSIHEGTKEIMVKVINRETEEVIREIPPEKILDMVAKMWEISGILVDERR